MCIRDRVQTVTITFWNAFGMTGKFSDAWMLFYEPSVVQSSWPTPEPKDKSRIDFQNEADRATKLGTVLRGVPLRDAIQSNLSIGALSINSHPRLNQTRSLIQAGLTIPDFSNCAFAKNLFALRLSNLGIYDIPPNFSEIFPNLIILDLSCNVLWSIPNSFSTFSRLQALILYNNCNLPPWRGWHCNFRREFNEEHGTISRDGWTITAKLPASLKLLNIRFDRDARFSSERDFFAGSIYDGIFERNFYSYYKEARPDLYISGGPCNPLGESLKGQLEDETVAQIVHGIMTVVPRIRRAMISAVEYSFKYASIASANKPIEDQRGLEVWTETYNKIHKSNPPEGRTPIDVLLLYVPNPRDVSEDDWRTIFYNVFVQRKTSPYENYWAVVSKLYQFAIQTYNMFPNEDVAKRMVWHVLTGTNDAEPRGLKRARSEARLSVLCV